MRWEPKRCGVLKCGVAAAVVIDPAVARLAAERFGALGQGFGAGLCPAHWRGLYPLALPGPEAPGAGGSRERDAPGDGAARAAAPDAVCRNREKKKRAKVSSG